MRKRGAQGLALRVCPALHPLTLARVQTHLIAHQMIDHGTPLTNLSCTCIRVFNEGFNIQKRILQAFEQNGLQRSRLASESPPDPPGHRNFQFSSISCQELVPSAPVHQVCEEHWDPRSGESALVRENPSGNFLASRRQSSGQAALTAARLWPSAEIQTPLPARCVLGPFCLSSWNGPYVGTGLAVTALTPARVPARNAPGRPPCPSFPVLPGLPAREPPSPGTGRKAGMHHPVRSDRWPAESPHLRIQSRLACDGGARAPSGNSAWY